MVTSIGGQKREKKTKHGKREIETKIDEEDFGDSMQPKLMLWILLRDFCVPKDLRVILRVQRDNKLYLYCG